MADAGGGYIATVRGGKVNIRPTLVNGQTLITLGIGNATFTFDPRNPPSVVRSLLTGDSDRTDDNIIYDVGFAQTRSETTFNEVQNHSEQWTDANGRQVTINAPKLVGFQKSKHLSLLGVSTSKLVEVRHSSRIMW